MSKSRAYHADTVRQDLIVRLVRNRAEHGHLLDTLGKTSYQFNGVALRLVRLLAAAVQPIIGFPEITRVLHDGEAHVFTLHFMLALLLLLRFTAVGQLQMA